MLVVCRLNFLNFQHGRAEPLSLSSFNMEFFLDKAATNNSLSQNSIPCWTKSDLFSVFI